MMLTTETQFKKFIAQYPNGKIFVYPSQTKGQYTITIFAHSVIEWCSESLYKKLLAKKVVFPFVAYTVDREKLKKEATPTA